MSGVTVPGNSAAAPWRSTGAGSRRSMRAPTRNSPPARPRDGTMRRILPTVRCRGLPAGGSDRNRARATQEPSVMKFWLSLVSVRETPQLPELARCAEELGFHGLMVGDHLIWPAQIRTRYPYSPDGKIFVPPDTPWPDPWVLFAHLGALTRRLQFASNIYLAALRDPLTVAKSVASAAVLTQGRIVCGVSAGWLEEEYQAAGVDFESRGRRLDEILVAMRELLSGQMVSHDGPLFKFHGIMRPAPAQPVRIW